MKAADKDTKPPKFALKAHVRSIPKSIKSQASNQKSVKCVPSSKVIKHKPTSTIKLATPALTLIPRDALKRHKTIQVLILCT